MRRAESQIVCLNYKFEVLKAKSTASNYELYKYYFNLVYISDRTHS